MSSLIVKTKSPKDCEDGYLTGYLITLTVFGAIVFLSLICESMVMNKKLKTDYYNHFFRIAIQIALFGLLINFIGNLISGNDCGFYSVRGLTAYLLTICSFVS
jgi:hypothetical protein